MYELTDTYEAPQCTPMCSRSKLGVNSRSIWNYAMKVNEYRACAAWAAQFD